MHPSIARTSAEQQARRRAHPVLGLRRRSFAVGGLAVAVALALSACSTGASGGGGGAGSTAKGTSLTILTYIDAPTTALLRKATAQFTKESGIKVTVEDLPGSGAAVYPGKLRTELAGGKGPDMWQTWGGSLGEPYTSGGFALNLSAYYKKYGWDKLIPQTAIDGMKWNGVTYGLPLYQQAVEAWYSKAAFTKAGITAPPTTYAELMADNQKLVDSGQVPAGLGGKFGWDVMRLFEYLLEKNAGPALHDKLLAGKADWNDPAVVQSFTDLKEWVDKGYLPKGVMALDPTQEEGKFTQGKYAYSIIGGWADTSYVQRAKDPSAYGNFALPTDQTPARHSGWVEGWMINKASPNQDAAAKLLNYLATPKALALAGTNNSTVKAAAPDAAKLPLSAANVQLAADQPFYTIQDQAFPAEVANGYFEVQSQVVQGQMTRAAAAKQMQIVVSTGLK